MKRTKCTMMQTAFLVLFILTGSVISEQAKSFTHGIREEDDGDVSDDSGLQKREEENKVPNIEYVLRGYNILTGNPLSTGGSYDPGFKGYIFKRTYKNHANVAKGVPDHVNVAVTESCNYDFSSDTMSTMTDYQSKLMVKASVEGQGSFGVVDAAFSLSAEYNKFRKDVETSGKTIIKAEASCRSYDAFLETGTPPQLSENFVAFAKRLVETGDYQSFLNSFGTHFVNEVQMGVRYTSLREISKQSKEEMENEGINLKLAASASTFGKSVSASSEVNYDQEKTEKFESLASSTIISTVGGKPHEQDDALKWISEQKKNPLPLSYRLSSILDLFQPFYFEGVNIDLTATKLGLQEHLTVYCEQSKPIQFPDAECAGPPRNCKGGNLCSVHAICNDTGLESYECICKEGYYGNGKTCTKVMKWENKSAIIEHQYTKGPWGTWGAMELCENGVFATGYTLRAEESQGKHDDSGANAVCIRCGLKDVCSEQDTWGDWSGRQVCPIDSFLSGWRQNIEPDQGSGDDSALDNVEYRCRDWYSWEHTATLKVEAEEWGRWSRWKECPEDEFICGIQTRVDRQSSDITALNDIKHQCCKPMFRLKKTKKKSKKMKKAGKFAGKAILEKNEAA